LILFSASSDSKPARNSPIFVFHRYFTAVRRQVLNSIVIRNLQNHRLGKLIDIHQLLFSSLVSPPPLLPLLCFTLLIPTSASVKLL
jgi:hypothetical protein